jgi:hypothetical protein
MRNPRRIKELVAKATRRAVRAGEKNDPRYLSRCRALVLLMRNPRKIKELVAKAARRAV